MKYIVKFFVVTFLILASTYAYAEQKIVYIDMKIVLNESKAGKEAQDFLQKTFKSNQKKFAEELLLVNRVAPHLAKTIFAIVGFFEETAIVPNTAEESKRI